MGVEDGEIGADEVKQVNQPPIRMGDFEHGLCSCFQDCNICLLSFCCPCIQYGNNWKKLSSNSDAELLFFLTCLGCCAAIVFDKAFCFFPTIFASFIGRYYLREKLGLEPRLALDTFASVCCPCCMLAQDGIELKKRGM